MTNSDLKYILIDYKLTVLFLWNKLIFCISNSSFFNISFTSKVSLILLIINRILDKITHAKCFILWSWHTLWKVLRPFKGLALFLNLIEWNCSCKDKNNSLLIINLHSGTLAGGTVTGGVESFVDFNETFYFCAEADLLASSSLPFAAALSLLFVTFPLKYFFFCYFFISAWRTHLQWEKMIKSYL